MHKWHADEYKAILDYQIRHAFRVYLSLFSLKTSSSQIVPLLLACLHWLPSLPMMAGLDKVAAAPPGVEAVDLRCLRLLFSRLAR